VSLRRAARAAWRLALLEAASRGSIARVVAPLPPRVRRALAADLRTLAACLLVAAVALVVTRAYPLAAVGALAAWPLWLADQVDL
jgi:hypothetical protein